MLCSRCSQIRYKGTGRTMEEVADLLRGAHPLDQYDTLKTILKTLDDYGGCQSCKANIKRLLDS